MADAMITHVKLSSPDATVGELRSMFEDEHVHAAVIVDRGRLLAVVDRADLVGADDRCPAAGYGSLGPRVVHPDGDLAEARQQLLASGRRRLAVVDHDRRFRGLLCLKRHHRGFCTNRDVAARSAQSVSSRV